MENTMTRKSALSILLLSFLCFNLWGQSSDKGKILHTMKRATEYMMNVAAYKGGFVWNYLPDYSRTWGELEAKRTMVWIQPPGTPSVGHLLLDIYHATGDEYYYESAKQVANALMWGQLPCGGWNYMFDFAGEFSLKEWYATIGKSAWRLEEFQHYYGNATFDDGGTISAAKFLLRMYVEKNDPAFRLALDKSIDFVLKSQYPIGGWPQRYPLMYNHPFQNKEDYSSFITLNDDVSYENMEFLLMCHQALGLQKVKEPLYRAMNLMLLLQQGTPYAGWADQYTVVDLKPAHARSYEPRSINTSATLSAISLLGGYYCLTGETKFLSGIPAALDYLESIVLPDTEKPKFNYKKGKETDVLLPQFVDPDNGKPLYVHRKGSNVFNGCYYLNQDLRNTIAHYGSARYCDLRAIRNQYEALKKLSPQEVTKDSPLLTTRFIPLPTYFSRIPEDVDEAQVSRLIRSLTKEGYWLTPLTSVSKPYRPAPQLILPDGTDRYATTLVGDEYDTSCYRPDKPVMGISTGTFISNMSVLIKALTNDK